MDLATPRPAAAPLQLHGIEPDSVEADIVAGVVVCAARWGMSRTTVDDIARESGVSRATVYRLFPGGKPAVLDVAKQVEVIGLLSGVITRLDDAISLEESITVLLHDGFVGVSAHPVLSFMRDHEPAELAAFLSFDRLSQLFETAADLMSPGLHRYLDAVTATEVVIWASRLVISHYMNPDPDHSLADAEFSRGLVRKHFVPALVGNQPTEEYQQ